MGEDPLNRKIPQSLTPFHIFLILAVIALIVEAATIAANIIFSPAPYPWGFDEYLQDADADARGGMEFLTDDEVRETGLPCTELDHFDIQATSLLDDIYEILKTEGLDVVSADTDSYNQKYGDGGSWYETMVNLSLAVPGYDNGYQRLTLNYDTATGQLHEIDMFISDEDILIRLTSDLLWMLDTRTHTFDGSSSREAQEALARSVERRENLYAVYGEPQTSGYITLTLYCYEDGFSIYIARE